MKLKLFYCPVVDHQKNDNENVSATRVHLFPWILIANIIGCVNRILLHHHRRANFAVTNEKPMFGFRKHFKLNKLPIAKTADA